MGMRVELQPAYVIHSRPYRDSSLIVDFITPEHGQLSAVVKGVRGSGKSAQQRRALLQPFMPLLITWGGKSTLKNLFDLESTPGFYVFQGRQLFSALYINELVSRLVKASDDSADIFLLYKSALADLSQSECIEVVLRRFELQLLILLGYGLSIDRDIESGKPVMAGNFYQLVPGQGLRYVAIEKQASDHFAGEVLLAISQGDYSPEVLPAAKRLCRLALGYYLGPKPLKSRDLFISS